MRGLSLVVPNRGYSLVVVFELLIAVTSCCGVLALKLRLGSCGA